jgi:uncharacterized protein (TIGR03067 family)
MQALRNGNSSYARYVELLFAQENMESWSASQAPALVPGLRADAALRQPRAQPDEAPQPPPSLENASDLRAAQAWFQAERARLEEYAQDQFSQIQGQHQEALARQYQKEAELAKREREVHREVKFLAAQAEALRERAHGLAEWEASLKAHTDQLSQVEEQVAAAQVGLGQVSLASPAVPRPEASPVRLSQAAAQTKFEAVETLIRERLEAWEKKQAEVLARQEQMERRYRELEKTEEAVARRMAELDELEESPLTPRGQQKRWEEMQQRCRELERAEAAVARRMAELDDLEASILNPQQRPDPAQEAVRREQEKLTGTWKLVALETNGQPSPVEGIADFRFIFTGDKLTRQRGDQPESAAGYRVDPTKLPKWMDMTGKAEGKDYSIPAVYALAGDTLKLCYRADYKKHAAANSPAQRPARLDGAAPAAVLLTLQREQI